MGAGVIGCAAALELAKAGIRSTVVDASGIGTEASWASAGVATHSNPGRGPYSRLRRLGYEYFCEFVQELQEESAADLGFERTGSLELSFTEQEEIKAKRWDAEYVKCDLPRERLTPAEATEMDACISSEIIAARFQVNDCQVRNPRLLPAIAEAAKRRGAEFKLHTRVTGLIAGEGKILGVRTADEEIHAGMTILAAGAWSTALAGTVGLSLPLYPSKGQMALLEGPPGKLKHIIKGGGMYCIPRPDGKILLGATVEEAGLDKRVTAEGIRSVLAAAFKIAPALKGLPIIQQWAGLRPYTARKGGPLLGPVPGLDNFIVATGHYRNGILLGPVTGLMVKELVRSEQPSLDLSAYRPDR
ncbi:MAG: FAD-dependent oxidoreductase [Planctomycetota bacterium]|nr:FAD-dependent oxidoreductase [Planctomycetota bacterium]MDP7130500.1 FAD-dependent oxidoreductase [Planctomycetota bacterium]MDP7251386.1 FAD-dependent oxidoreductase [Planctomycetota bacterium]